MRQFASQIWAVETFCGTVEDVAERALVHLLFVGLVGVVDAGDVFVVELQRTA